MSQRGFSLVEVLLAVALVGTVILGVLPAFVVCKDTNTGNELRSGAAAAAQSVMEAYRREDPATLPTSGSSPLQVITVGDRDYEVVTHFCVESVWCDLQSRHLVVEVGFGTETILSIESVYTKLR
jgi:prepilin-type N-terminal cleavage/methylation domain-containing protein